MAVEPTKGPKLKTKRGLMGVVMVIGVLMLILYLFAAKGPDLGQSKINAKHAEEAKKAQDKVYADTVADPHGSSANRMRKAREAVQSKRVEKRRSEQANLPPMPSMGDLEPPSDMAGSAVREQNMDDARRAAMSKAPSTNNAGTEAAAPGFVMYQAAAKKDGGSQRLSLDTQQRGSDDDASADDSAAAENPAMKAALARLESLKAMQEKRLQLAQAKSEQTGAPGGESSQAWLYHKQNDKVGESKAIVAQRSKGLYWLAPGTIIHAVALSAIDTSLPGSVVARVTEPVYDSRYGSRLVIPAGSTLKGSYNSSVQDGQERVQIAFDHIITPAGGMIPIKGLAGADGLGRSGVKGKLHTHFWKRMGIATLMAAEAVGLDRLNDKKQVVTGTGASGSLPVSSGGQILVNAANQELKRRYSLGPNITVPPGAVLTIATNTAIEVPPIANAR